MRSLGPIRRLSRLQRVPQSPLRRRAAAAGAPWVEDSYLAFDGVADHGLSATWSPAPVTTLLLKLADRVNAGGGTYNYYATLADGATANDQAGTLNRHASGGNLYLQALNDAGAGIYTATDQTLADTSTGILLLQLSLDTVNDEITWRAIVDGSQTSAAEGASATGLQTPDRLYLGQRPDGAGARAAIQLISATIITGAAGILSQAAAEAWAVAGSDPRDLPGTLVDAWTVADMVDAGSDSTIAGLLGSSLSLTSLTTASRSAL